MPVSVKGRFCFLQATLDSYWRPRPSQLRGLGVGKTSPSVYKRCTLTVLKTLARGTVRGWTGLQCATFVSIFPWRLRHMSVRNAGTRHYRVSQATAIKWTLFSTPQRHIYTKHSNLQPPGTVLYSAMSHTQYVSAKGDTQVSIITVLKLTLYTHQHEVCIHINTKFVYISTRSLYTHQHEVCIHINTKFVYTSTRSLYTSTRSLYTHQHEVCIHINKKFVYTSTRSLYIHKHEVCMHINTKFVYTSTRSLYTRQH